LTIASASGKQCRPETRVGRTKTKTSRPNPQGFGPHSLVPCIVIRPKTIGWPPFSRRNNKRPDYRAGPFIRWTRNQIKNRRNLCDFSGTRTNGGGLGIPLFEQQHIEITLLYFPPQASCGTVLRTVLSSPKHPPFNAILRQDTPTVNLTGRANHSRLLAKRDLTQLHGKNTMISN